MNRTCRRRDSISCILPPYILERLVENVSDPGLRHMAIESLQEAAAARAVRTTFAAMPTPVVVRSPTGAKHRLVYDMRHRRYPLPGTLARSEGDAPVTDL